MTEKLRQISSILLSIILLFSLTACGEAAELGMIFLDSQLGIGAIAYSAEDVVIINDRFEGDAKHLSDRLTELSVDEISAYVLCELSRTSVETAAEHLTDHIVNVLYIPEHAATDEDLSSLIGACNINDTDIVTVDGSMSFGIGFASVKLDLSDGMLVASVNVGEKNMLIGGADNYPDDNKNVEQYDLLCVSSGEDKPVPEVDDLITVYAGRYTKEPKNKVYDTFGKDVTVFTDGKKIRVEG